MLGFLRYFWTKAFGSSGYGALPSFRQKQPTWASVGYGDFVRQGYQSLVWVYRCVREIAEAVSSVPWQVFEISEDGTRVPRPQHKLAKLLNKPNPIMTRSDIMELWAIYICLAGNCFVEVVRRGQENNQGLPLELYVLRPDRMKVIPDPETFVMGYEMDVMGEKIPYRPDEIIHWKYPDPLNEHIGMSPLQSGRRIIDTENNAVNWNKVKLENNAAPGGALIVPQGKHLTPFQRLRFKEQLSNRFSKDNAHRPMLLEGGMQWQQMELSHRDMEFLEQRKLGAREICAIFGVPPWLVGAAEPKYENYEVARLSFWEETVVTLLERLKNGINQRVSPLFGDNVEVDYDLRNVPAMRASFKTQVDMAERLVKLGWSLNQVNERLGLGFEEVEWGNEPLVSATMIPISAAIAAGKELTEGGDDDEPKPPPKPKPEEDEDEDDEE